ncbi:unnamed protein product, partial [Gadus morhua 'NCC']
MMACTDLNPSPPPAPPPQPHPVLHLPAPHLALPTLGPRLPRRRSLDTLSIKPVVA